MENKKAKEIDPIVMFDEQFFNKRDCGLAQIDVTLDDKLGFYDDSFDCANSKIDWMDGGIDYITVEPEFPEFTIERNDVSSSKALMQTSAEKMSGTMTVPILVKWNSRLFQWITNFNMNESSSGRDGKGIVALSNGGVHMQRKITYNKGKVDEFQILEVYMNLKFENWWDMINGEVTAETTFEFSLLIENFPDYYIMGTVPQGYGLPTSVTPATIEYYTAVLTYTELTISNLTLTGVDSLAIDDLIYVTTYSDTGLILDSQTLLTGEYVYTSDLTLFDKLFVQLAYKKSDILMYSTIVLEVPKTAVVPPALLEKGKKNGKVS